MATWPTSVATDANLYLAVNELQTNLSSGITNNQTTITLNSTTSFPTVGLVLIDNEVIKYTGVSGSNLTGCTRAFDGTTAATHSGGAVVSFAFCAAHHNTIKDEVIAVESYLDTALGKGTTVLAAEFQRLSGVTSAIQTQLNAKAPLASPSFTTPTLGAATATSLAFSPTTGGIVGTPTNDNAGSGKVGEYISSVVGLTNVPVATTVYYDLTSITLTAGDWDVSVLYGIYANGATLTLFQTFIGLVPGNSSSGFAVDNSVTDFISLSFNQQFSAAIPAYRLSLAGTTTVYFKSFVNYSAGTPQTGGRISARRVR